MRRIGIALLLVALLEWLAYRVYRLIKIGKMLNSVEYVKPL
jgi:hypothetical protein